LATVGEPDERWAHFTRALDFSPITLADRHTDLRTIDLADAVPAPIREHFNTGKNLLLYAWFVYRFIPVAELHAYSTVEMALRERAKLEGRPERLDRKGRAVPWKFSELLQMAVKERWIVDDGFTVVRRRREANAELFEQLGDVPASDADMQNVNRYCNTLVESMPWLRNHLAHGSTSVHPGGMSTLRVCADLINQLFSWSP
jgi:hypothetical protein